MARRIAIIQCHPDAARRHLCHALAGAYANGAQASGHEVRSINVGELDFPVLRSKGAFETGVLPPALAPSQAAIGRADHLLIVYPLWLGTMPALLKAYSSRCFRPGCERSILGFAGIGPIRESLFGTIEQATDAKRRVWLTKLRRLGTDGI